MTTERDHIETAARLLDGDDHAMNDQMHGQPADMSDKTDLTAAIAEVVRATQAADECGEAGQWDGRDFCQDQPLCDPHPIDHAIAAILNAVVSGDLVPAARRPTVAGGNGSAVRGR